MKPQKHFTVTTAGEPAPEAGARADLATEPASLGAEGPELGSGRMFDRIADRYDLVNRIISLGVDRSWRHETVDALEIRPGDRILDVATGTADLALRVLGREASATTVGLDPSERMLELARDKARALGFEDRIELRNGTAEALPFDDGTFDGLCIAFGIRNVPDRARALREFGRVTRPGRRIAILELSDPAGGVLGPLARFHIHTVVPWLGSLLSGSREYRYLEQSIAAFPPPEAFAGMMTDAGLRVVEVKPLTFGVCCLFVAEPRGPR